MIQTYTAGTDGRLGKVQVLTLTADVFQWFAYDRPGRMVAHGSAGTPSYARTLGQIELTRDARRRAELTRAR